MSASRFVLHVDSRLLSPYAMSAYVALVEKAVPFELRFINLEARQQNERDYGRRSLTQRVPMISRSGFNLSESSAISEYLEEMYPAPGYLRVYPATIEDRARARQIQAWLRSDLLPIREERSTEIVFLGKAPERPLSTQAAAAADKLVAALEVLLPSDSLNLFGDWCIADTDCALMLNRLILAGEAVPERLANYARHQWQRPAVQSWLNLAGRH